ncbi:Acyl-coenzyme A:6-aminopenicillanic-acid-acyltransferase 40 kDa form [Colletotrichum siamense]|nr:Acyl-coenzyme A:6-aminopenicillanic-acid-acyltransferase 40 kDa form [Colletotrichum siamense]
MVEQSPNLIACHITQTGLPKISMITEAGIIGKIGLNSAGVGVCLNAIRAYGVDHTKLPIHLALRTVLESNSKTEAIEKLVDTGVAGSGHILVADPTGGEGLECTSKGILKIPVDEKGLVVHSNHLLLEHPGVVEPPWLQDSHRRVVRLRQLAEHQVQSGGGVGASKLLELFKDQKGYPGSINRHQVQDCKTQTLFNIIMDLSKKRATVKFGRPTENGQPIKFAF